MHGWPGTTTPPPSTTMAPSSTSNLIQYTKSGNMTARARVYEDVPRVYVYACIQTFYDVNVQVVIHNRAVLCGMAWFCKTKDMLHMHLHMKLMFAKLRNMNISMWRKSEAPVLKESSSEIVSRCRILTNLCFAGVIRVSNTSTVLGYISRSYVIPQVHRFATTPSITDAMNVTLSIGAGNATDIKINNGPDPSYPYLGFVVGPASSNNDLAPGSYNYLLLTASKQTASGSTPSNVGNAYSTEQLSESAVWTTASSNTISAQWVNSDGSKPLTTLVFQAGGLLATGDEASFNQKYPGAVNAIFTIV